MTDEPKHRLLEQALGLERDVFVDGLDRARSLARGQPEKLHQVVGESLGVGVGPVVDEARFHLVVPALSAFAHHHREPVANLQVLAPVGGEAHHLVLAIVGLEAEISVKAA